MPRVFHACFPLYLWGNKYGVPIPASLGSQIAVRLPHVCPLSIRIVSGCHACSAFAFYFFGCYLFLFI